MRKRNENAFYERVDNLCEEKCMTHRELAECIGVDPVSLSRYLTGERRMQLEPFMKMCETFDVPAEDLYQTYLYAEMMRRVIEYRAKQRKK